MNYYNDYEARMTHSELVQKAARWLARKYPVVITEMASQREEPDAIGFNKIISTTVECKVSHADFMADSKKNSSRMGYYRWYLVPDGMVKPEEVPPGWGLLYASDRGVSEVLFAGVGHPDRNLRAEVGLLVSCIRRIGKNTPSGISVRCYTYETKNRATLGIETESAHMRPTMNNPAPPEACRKQTQEPVAPEGKGMRPPEEGL